MTSPLALPPAFAPAPFCSADAEARLNLFADGDLDAAEEPALFAHLAACPACRAQFNALLAFRRAVRQDRLALPPAADEAFFAALDRRRRAPFHAADRAALRHRARSPLRRRIPLGAALVLCAVVLSVGLFAGRPDSPTIPEARPFVVAETVTADGQPIYVVAPGVEVRAPRAQ